jgi:outer membrane immunogenic protein
VGAFGGGLEGAADWGYAVGEVSPHIGGYLLGSDIGYNVQLGSLVLGIEEDISGTNSKGTIACAPLSLSPRLFAAPMFQMNCNSSASWLATATARVGYVWDRLLLYLKGGGAWTNERFSASCNLGPTNGLIASQVCTNPADAFSGGLTLNTLRGGEILGFGSEFALTSSWSAKAETDYVSFGNRIITASDGSPLNVGMHIWEAKIGVNYRFHVGSAATTF